ncbi:PAS domain S-box protein [Candidatus Sumerlaeota bacterium]|nr:PAS domain S-box protein [Candidatus Sumerlaeota bacterium]
MPAAVSQMMSQHSSDAMWYTDARGKILHASGAVEGLLGLGPDRLIGPSRIWRRLVHPDDQASALPTLESPVDHLGNDQSELVFRVVDGEGRPTRRLRVELSEHRDASGRLRGVLGVARDLTCRLAGRPEAPPHALCDSLEGRPGAIQFEQILRKVRAATLVFDLEGNVTFANEAALELWGLDSEAMAKTSLWDLYVAEIPVAPGAQGLSLEGGRADHREGEFTIRRGDGNDLPCFVSFTLIRNPAGVPTGLVAISRDVTADKMLQQEVLQAQKMDSVGNLAGGVAHDFNNLLAGILGYAEMIRESAKPGTRLHSQVEFIEASATRASHLTQQLLSFSRKGKYNLRVTTLNEIVSGAKMILEGSLPKSILLHVDLDPDPCRIEVDPNQLAQVILNLGLNARDAIPRAGWITLRVRTRRLDADFCRDRVGLEPGTYAELMVKDTGQGMSDETQAHIFEPFFTTKELNKGTGLGLSVVYGIVHNHGGHIEVHSSPGVGTQFVIHLPATERPITVDETPEDVAGDGGQECILVVDDEPTIRELVTDILQPLGYSLLRAKDGMEAIELFTRSHGEIALVLLDMQMPTLNGLETFRRLREIDPEVRVILSSGYGMDQDIQEIIREGVLGFIQKPYKINELTRIVRDCLDRQ